MIKKILRKIFSANPLDTNSSCAGSSADAQRSGTRGKNMEVQESDQLHSVAQWTMTRPEVIRYQLIRHEITGQESTHICFPQAYSWPLSDSGLTYALKLKNLLPLQTGKGAEIGPLNMPTISKDEANVLYVDHLDTEGLKAKYKHLGDSIAPVDCISGDGGLKEALAAHAPLDYILGSQVMEHTPDPIRWLQDIADLLCEGGLLSIALPTREMTFDLLRQESSAGQMLSAYYAGHAIPEPGRVYDHHALTRAINTPHITKASLTPDEVFAAKGGVTPFKVTGNHMALVEKARSGEYLDVHVWVFTDWSFLMEMAQLAGDGFIPFGLRQFYPTGGGDRGDSSFVAVLEKNSHAASAALRKSFLMALAPTNPAG